MKYVAPQMKVFDVDLLNDEILAAACSGYCKKNYTTCDEWCSQNFTNV